MRIGFVLQDLRRAPTGLDCYTWNLWHALRSLETEHELVPVLLPMEIAGRAVLRTLWEQLCLPLWAARHKIDLLHVPAGSAPVLRRRPCVLTLHDLGEDATPSYRTALGPRLYFGRVVPGSARFATAIVSDSETTKRDAMARLGIPAERIAVVPLAAAPAFRKLPPQTVADVRRKYGLGDRYFLHVGAPIARKNLSGALLGFARFSERCPEPEMQFVVAGGDGGRPPPLPPEAQELAAWGRVRFLGHVPQEDLVALYSGALAVVLASFYEGFGFPLVEAFACGTPAIASRVASIPEVAGDAALYVDPHDPVTIADAVAQYATSPEFREEMARRARERSRRFSWRRTAEATLAVYQRALAAGRPSERRSFSRAVTGDGQLQPKILFLRLDSLGDLVLTTPCFQALKRRYPAARVDVVVQPGTAPLLEGDRHVDHVFTFAAPWRGRRRLSGLAEAWQLLRRLRQERYDCVVTPRRDLDDALFVRLCGGRRTLGFFAWRTRPFLSDWVPFRPDRHLVENHLRLLAPLGCEQDGLRPAVSCTSGDRERIDALLGPTARARPPIGLAPFASTEAKTLAPQRTAELIDALAQQFGAPVALLGGPGDRARADQFLGRSAAPAIDLVGRTSIPELCDVLRRCRLLVCVDSAPMHLAAALGVPTVALFGEEDPVVWGPYGEAPHRVLSMAGVGRSALREAVLAAVAELLAEGEGVCQPTRAQVEVAS